MVGGGHGQEQVGRALAAEHRPHPGRVPGRHGREQGGVAGQAGHGLMGPFGPGREGHRGRAPGQLQLGADLALGRAGDRLPAVGGDRVTGSTTMMTKKSVSRARSDTASPDEPVVWLIAVEQSEAYRVRPWSPQSANNGCERPAPGSSWIGRFFADGGIALCLLTGNPRSGSPAPSANASSTHPTPSAGCTSSSSRRPRARPPTPNPNPQPPGPTAPERPRQAMARRDIPPEPTPPAEPPQPPLPGRSSPAASTTTGTGSPAGRSSASATGTCPTAGHSPAGRSSASAASPGGLGRAGQGWGAEHRPAAGPAAGGPDPGLAGRRLPGERGPRAPGPGPGRAEPPEAGGADRRARRRLPADRGGRAQGRGRQDDHHRLPRRDLRRAAAATGWSPSTPTPTGHPRLPHPPRHRPHGPPTCSPTWTSWSATPTSAPTPPRPTCAWR